MRLFFDNNMAPRLVEVVSKYCLMNGKGIEMVHCRTMFPANTPDSIWISALAEEKDWTIITRDRRIAHNPDERRLMRNPHIRFVFLPSEFACAPIKQQKILLSRHIKRLSRELRNNYHKSNTICINNQWKLSTLDRLDV